MPTEYIGMLSRLLPVRPEPVRYDQLFLLSGPEPQRSRLERRLLDEAQRLGKPTLLVRGVTEGGFTRRKSANLEVVSYLTTDGLNKAIAQSRLVVCRPGYSTLMDLARLGKRAVLIPTPGQTEQEYLAAQLFHQGKYFCQQQDRVDLREAWSRVDQFEGFSGTSFDGTALDRAIARFLKGEWN